ncbi:MAG: hypothetical protein FJ187_07510 [Gammaproteobacteria bacterium]|nr:hypothetical protein [Gammaproteobacteria bacterium]
MCFEVNMPQPVQRDPVQEAADTLLAQLEMEKGTGRFAGVGPRIEIEREYRPQYTQLDLDMARQALYGDRGNNGLIALMRQYGPEAAAIQNQLAAQQYEADIANVERLAPASRRALEAADPLTAALLAKKNALAMERLENPYGITPAEERLLRQNSREAAAARGLGYGPNDAYNEAAYVTQGQSRRFFENMGLAAQQAQQNQSFYGDPFTLIGRPMRTNSQGLVQQAQGFGPQQVFDPYNQYFGEAYASNINALNAQRIAQGNADAAIRGETIGMIGEVGGGLIGAGLFAA